MYELSSVTVFFYYKFFAAAECVISCSMYSVSRKCTNSTKDNLHFNLVFFNLTILMKKSTSESEKKMIDRMYECENGISMFI